MSLFSCRYLFRINMTMTFTEPKSFFSLTSKERGIFFEYLKDISLPENKDLAAVNMWSSDWENEPKTLMYILCKTDLLTDANGDYHVIFDEHGEVACSAGVYKSEFDKSFGLSTRLWVQKKYRNLYLGGYTLQTEMKKWCLLNNCKAGGMSFNEYNKNLKYLFKRRRGAPELTEKNLFYNGVWEVEFPIVIKYTKQWLLYEKFDLSYEFDWESIKAKD